MTAPLPRTWWIEPGRLLGGPFPGDTDPVEHDRKLRALVEVGLTHVVCLQEADERGHRGLPFPSYEARVRELAADRSVTWTRFPIRDLTAPTEETMAAILDHLAGLEGVVYLHCWGGHGRTGVVAGCRLRELGLGADEALARIAAARAHDPYLRRQPSPQTEDQLALVRGWSRRRG